MTDQTLTDRCPTWCGRHELEDGFAVHEAVLGFAGPLEVALVRSVPAGDEPVDELQLRDVGGYSTAGSEITMPLDPATVRALAELLMHSARATEGGSAHA